jgi:hypothetical protein
VLAGLIGAAAAAIAYGAATVLQAIGVQRMAAVPTGAMLRSRVAAGRPYALGLILDVLGFLASVAALRTLPLFLVESAVASSVAVTAVLAVLVLDLRLRRAEITALVVIGVGLVMLAVSAEPGPAHHTGGAAGWVLLGTVALVALLLLIGLRDAIVGVVFLGDAVRQHLMPVAVIGFLATLAGSLALADQAEIDAAQVR